MSLIRRKPPKKRRGEKDRRNAYIRRVEKDAEDPAVHIPAYTKSLVAEKARRENLDKGEAQRQAIQGAKDETIRKLTGKEKRKLAAAKKKAMKNRIKKKKKAKETAKKIKEIKIPTSSSYGVGGYND